MNPSLPSGESIGDDKISGYKLSKLSALTPQQQQLYSQLLGGSTRGTEQGLGLLSNVAEGQEGAFTQLERPAYAAFDKLLGQIGSRYAQAGAVGSSSFQNAVSGAGGELAQNLQGQRTQLQMNALDKLLGISGGLLNQRLFENVLTQKPQSNKKEMIGKLLSAALPAILGAFGGPGGAAAGSGLASLFGSSQGSGSNPLSPMRAATEAQQFGPQGADLSGLDQFLKV